MAVVKGGLHKITGTIQGATFYTIMGGDTVYLRMKGGPSKSQIKRSPSFEKVRRNNNEWAGCTKMASSMRYSLGHTMHLADYPVIGALNAIAKKIQVTTEGEEHGQRGLYLSKNKDLLLGFSVSHKQVLESVLRVPIKTSMNRETGTAQVIIPPINTEMFLYNFRNLPFFRLSVSMCGVSDMTFLEDKKKYEPLHPHYSYYSQGEVSDWFVSTSNVPQQIYDFQIEIQSFMKTGFPVPEEVTLVLTIGLEFGKVGTDGKPTPVKYAGCGKVLMVE